MNILDRYVIRTFLGSYVLLLLTGIGLYVFADVLVNLDELTEDTRLSAVGALLKIADYHGYKLPLYFYQLGGVLMCVAAAFTFAMMLKNNELAPLVAAGYPLQRLAVPVLGCSVLLAGLWLVNTELVMPRLAPQIARHYDDVGRARPVQVVCVRDDRKSILSATELIAAAGRLRQVHIIEPDADGRPTHVISADEAIWRPERQTWELVRGARLQMGAAFEGGDLGGPLEREPLAEYPFTLSPEQIRLRQSSQWAEMMSIRQMNALLKVRNLPNLAAIERSQYIRFTQPLLMWILILLAVPFFLTREPVNVLAAGGKALVLTGACFLVTFLAHSVSAETGLTQLAVALPVLIFGPVAVLHLANVKT